MTTLLASLRETLLLVLHIPSRHTTTKRLIEEALPKTEVLLLLLLLGNQRKTGKKFGTNNRVGAISEKL